MALVAATCSGSTDPSIEVRPNWGTVFEAEGAVGTIAVHRVGSDRIEVYDEARATTPRIPASTFKILNSLIILETGAMPDVDTEMAWDGVDRGIEIWNRDHSLRSGIEVSAVWLYQALAREVGTSRMAELVSEVGYGNTDIGVEIDRFWLDGDLRIDAIEQVEFLTRLVTDDLPFRAEVTASVRDILVRQSGDGWSWSHKTGTSLSSTPNLGWLVGTTHHGDEHWVFALNIDLEPVNDVGSQLDPQARQRIARKILEQVGALPTGVATP